MDFLTADRRRMLEAVSRLAYCNPFLPERMELERAVLGEAFEEGEPVWSQQVDDPDCPRPNVWRIAERLEPLLNELNARLHGGAKARDHDLVLYEDAALAPTLPAVLREIPECGGRLADGASTPNSSPIGNRYFAIGSVHFPSGHEPRHTFALLPADPARVRPIVSRRNRRLDARGAPAGGGMAIDLHARYAALPAYALRAHAGVRHAHHGPFGHGERVGGAGHRAIPIRVRLMTASWHLPTIARNRSFRSTSRRFRRRWWNRSFSDIAVDRSPARSRIVKDGSRRVRHRARCSSTNWVIWTRRFR